MCFKITCYRITPKNAKDERPKNKYIKLCRVDRKKCRKECLAPNKSCPFIKKVIKC